MADRGEVRQRPGRPIGTAERPCENECSPREAPPARQGERADRQHGLGSVTDPVVQSLPHGRRIPTVLERNGDDDSGDQGGRYMPAEEHGYGAPLPPPAFRPGQEAADTEAKGDQGAHEVGRGDVGERTVEEQRAAEQRGQRMVLQVVQVGAEVAQHGVRPIGGQPVDDPCMTGQEQADIGEGQRRTARVPPHGAEWSAPRARQ